MCVFQNCRKPDAPNSASWGVGSICADHFKDLTEFIKNWASVTTDWAEDYARICVLMMSPATLTTHLQALSSKLTEIEQGVNFNHLPNDDYRPNVHHTLQFYEKKCWFPTLHIIPLGVLTAPEFFAFIAKGYVLDDFGAGYTHGGYTHRLQWFAIMRASTAGFTRTVNWNHSAFELYTELGSTGTTPVKPGGINLPNMAEVMGANSQSVWGAMLDQAGTGPYYNRPDRLHHDINTGALSTTPIGIAIKQHQRDWGNRAWAAFRHSQVDTRLNQLVALESRKWFNRRNAQQLKRVAESSFDRELGADRPLFQGLGGASFSSNTVIAQKQLELDLSGWIRSQSGAMIRNGTKLNMTDDKVKLHRTGSRAVFAS